jgi:hypothetical protein
MDPSLLGPGDLVNANLDAYAANNPLNATDPYGHDLTGTLAVIGLQASLGAVLGIAFNGVANYSRGLPFLNNALFAGSVGAVAAPLSILFPPFGVALAGLGIIGSSANAYSVLANPHSSLGQDGAAVFLVLASIAGGKLSLGRFQELGWYAPLNPRTPVVNTVVLNRNSTMGELLPGVPDDALIHLSATRPQNLVGGVIRAGSFFVKMGAVKGLAFSEFQKQVVGPYATGSTPDADTIHIVLPGNGTFTPQAPGYISNIPEYVNDVNVAPDANAILDLNH